MTQGNHTDFMLCARWHPNASWHPHTRGIQTAPAGIQKPTPATAEDLYNRPRRSRFRASSPAPKSAASNHICGILSATQKHCDCKIASREHLPNITSRLRFANGVRNNYAKIALCSHNWNKRIRARLRYSTSKIKFVVLFTM